MELRSTALGQYTWNMWLSTCATFRDYRIWPRWARTSTLSPCLNSVSLVFQSYSSSAFYLSYVLDTDYFRHGIRAYRFINVKCDVANHTEPRVTYNRQCQHLFRPSRKPFRHRAFRECAETSVSLVHRQRPNVTFLNILCNGIAPLVRSHRLPVLLRPIVIVHLWSSLLWSLENQMWSVTVNTAQMARTLLDLIKASSYVIYSVRTNWSSCTPPFSIIAHNNVELTGAKSYELQHHHSQPLLI